MRILLTILISNIIYLPAFSQELRLFEETENSTAEREVSARPEAQRDSDGNLITTPTFKLIGTTRIGNRNVLVLEDRSGETISLSVAEGSPRPVPGYPNYRVLEVGPGQASIEYPANLSCIEFLDQGVACESQRLALLSLKNGSPLEPVGVGASGSTPGGVADSGDAAITVNPFEVILERAANPDMGIETDNSFTPRRINPEDVPPGMRVVSTPFGDRLVEIDQ